MVSLTCLSLVALATVAYTKPITNAPRAEQVQNTATITSAEANLLKLYSRYSAAAYCNIDTKPGKPVVCETSECALLNADKPTIVETFLTPESDVAAYVAVVDSRKEIVFAVRGTVSDANWAINLNFIPVDTVLVPGGWMHQGFYNAWAEISYGVRRAIFNAQLAHPGYKLVVTGHSLGGAIATIAAAYLRAIDGYQLDLYTYGQPRVGNDVFSDFISSQPGRLYRVTHGEDPVPRVPLAIMDYRHTSPEIFLFGKPTDPTNWPLHLSATCLGNLNWNCNSNLLLPVTIADHSLYYGSMGCRNDPGSGAAFNGTYFPEEIEKELKQELGADAVFAPPPDILGGGLRL